ncbi:MAG: hypothetical protein ACR2K9_08330 [Solirubrobacteraceae bacterium]
MKRLNASSTGRPVRRAICLGLLISATGSASEARADVGFSDPVPMNWATGSYHVDFTQGAPGEAILSTGIPDSTDGEGWRPRVAILSPGAANPTPQDLDGRSFLEPSVAANPTGQAVAAWTETSSGRSMTARMAVRAPGEAFGPGIDVPYGEGYVGNLKAAINSLGESVIVFTKAWSENPLRLWVVFRSAAGDFGAPIPISAPVTTGSWPYMDVKLDDSGRAVVAWSWGYRESRDRVNVATGTATGGFSDPQVVAGEEAYPGPVTLRLDRKGGAVLAWEDGEDNSERVQRRVMASFLGATGRFSSPQMLGRGMDSSGSLRLAGADDGHVIATWMDGRSGSEWFVRAAAGNIASQTFAPPQTVDGMYSPSLGVSRDGIAALAGQGGWQSDYAPVTSQGTASGEFGPSRLLLCPPPAGAVTTVGVAGPGDVSVVLSRESSDNVWTHELVRSDRLLQPLPERCGTAGEPDSGPPSGPPLPEEPPRVVIVVPSRVSLAHAQSLPIAVTSTTPGRLQVDGKVLTQGRAVSLRTVRRVAQSPGVLQVRARPQRRLHGARQRPRVLVVRVGFRDSHGRMHRLTRRVAVSARPR